MDFTQLPMVNSFLDRYRWTISIYVTDVENWLAKGTGEHSLFTDGIFFFPSVRMDTDGRNNFTKLTVGIFATVLGNSHISDGLEHLWSHYPTARK